MPEHQLPDGKRWIANLVALGIALGYRPEKEFDVAPEGEEEAPVDVAWFRSDRDDFPLFIFEVESSPSGQLTYNAAKVFTQDSALFEKPLFHFHFVLTGGGTSGRIKATEQAFGKFNYRVYRIAQPAEATAAVCDVLSQHRRVSEAVDVISLAESLPATSWPEVELDAVWEGAAESQMRNGASPTERVDVVDPHADRGGNLVGIEESAVHLTQPYGLPGAPPRR